MKLIQVFDAASSHSTGTRVGQDDQARAFFAADVEWAIRAGARIERFDLAQHPSFFAEDPAVRRFVERSGHEGLPLVLVDGEMMLAGRYPMRSELADWAGLAASVFDLKPTSGCCGSCC